MKALKIDTELRTIKQIEINHWKEIAPNISDVCKYFECPIILPNEDTFYVDDEGLFNDYLGGFSLIGSSYPIKGNAILLGADKDGNSTDYKTDIQWLIDNLKLYEFVKR